MKAMANHRTLIFLCLLGVLICASDLYAEDTDCGDAPVTVSSEKAFATKAAVGGLAQKLANLEASVDWKSKIISVIDQFPDADVKAINIGAWVIVCKTIRNSNMSDTDKVSL